MYSNNSKQTNWAQFVPLVTVFFFWGFVAASNDILIPVFKKAFNLTQSQSQYVAVAFYVAYTVGSLIYMFISKALKQDLINKIGYKNGLITGLLISAAGNSSASKFVIMVSCNVSEMGKRTRRKESLKNTTASRFFCFFGR